MTETRISVIIPYYNAGAFIEGALETVRRQAVASLEIILVDDGSTDDIAKRVKTFGRGILFLQQENKGPAAARNLGLKHATGDMIAFLDADDRWPDNKLVNQLARFETTPDLGIVTGRIQYVHLEGAENMPVRFQDNNTLVHVHLGAMLVRRKVFDVIGQFDESLRFSEDQDWFLRARERRIGIAIMPEITLIYQQHATNMTRGQDIRGVKLMNVLKLSLDRRRRTHSNGDVNLLSLSSHDDAL